MMKDALRAAGSDTGSVSHLGEWMALMKARLLAVYLVVVFYLFPSDEFYFLNFRSESCFFLYFIL